MQKSSSHYYNNFLSHIFHFLIGFWQTAQKIIQSTTRSVYFTTHTSRFFEQIIYWHGVVLNSFYFNIEFILLLENDIRITSSSLRTCDKIILQLYNINIFMFFEWFRFKNSFSRTLSGVCFSKTMAGGNNYEISEIILVVLWS